MSQNWIVNFDLTVNGPNGQQLKGTLDEMLDFHASLSEALSPFLQDAPAPKPRTKKADTVVTPPAQTEKGEQDTDVSDQTEVGDEDAGQEVVPPVPAADTEPKRGRGRPSKAAREAAELAAKQEAAKGTEATNGQGTLKIEDGGLGGSDENRSEEEPKIEPAAAVEENEEDKDDEGISFTASGSDGVPCKVTLIAVPNTREGDKRKKFRFAVKHPGEDPATTVLYDAPAPADPKSGDYYEKQIDKLFFDGTETPATPAKKGSK